jgi:hypothetical protein
MGIPINWQGMMVIVIEETGQETGDRPVWCLLKGYRSYIKEPMATEAHGKHGIFTDNFCVFRGFRGYLSRFRIK